MDARFIAAVVTALMLAAPAGALDGGKRIRFGLGESGSDGLPAGWVLNVKEGTPLKYFDGDGKSKCFCLRSNSSSFSVQRHIHLDPSAYRYVTWRWKVKKLPAGADFRDSGRDDQAAQLFVAFHGRKAISYIWDTNAPVGATSSFSIPLVIEVKTVVVSSGGKGVGEWVRVTRNVYEDYRRLYGEEPPPAEGLRFQINSQHTRTTAEACLESVEFSKKI